MVGNPASVYLFFEFLHFLSYSSMEYIETYRGKQEASQFCSFDQRALLSTTMTRAWTVYTSLYTKYVAI